MVAGNTEETALGSARGRFLEALPSKAVELRFAVAELSVAPSAEAPRDDILRHLHALHASALVFHNEALASAVQEGIERLDAAREAQRGLGPDDLELLQTLVVRLPGLRDDAPTSTPTAALAPAMADDEAPEMAAVSAADVEPHAPSAGLLPAWDARTEPLLQRVLHVLLLAQRSEQQELIDLLRSDSVRISSVASVAELIESVREDAPDLVLADERLAREGKLIPQLREDPSSDFIPVVVFETGEAGEGSVADADVSVPRPFTGEQLVRAMGRATGTLVAAREPEEVGDVTLDELAARVAKEVQRGLVDAAQRGRSERVALGDGASLLAATYAALSEMRAAVVRESGGQVQFAPRAADGGPSLLAPTAPFVAPGVDRLLGRRIILVEDDTAIVLLLANLLREQGATVHELTDGRETLEAARRERPDLVLSGARLPNVDVFALCRELAEDPLLADVPVLLLPPKEQLLTRPREANATAQLQSELAEQVVGSVAQLLQARSEIEEQLKQPGEVRGSLDGTGVIALLRSVRRTRPDAHIRIRDAWNLFECDLRDGRLVQLTRTASDGGFVRNERALPQLLGASSGRFAVSAAQGALKTSFEGTLDEVITRGAVELAGELDAVSGPRLARVARVVFDEDAYASLVQQTPRVVRAIIERLYAGEPPLKLIKSGLVDPAALEPILLDMARRGALRGVVGSGGEDLVAEARATRSKEAPRTLSSPLSIVPPPPSPVISMLPDTQTVAEAQAAAATASGLVAAPTSAGLVSGSTAPSAPEAALAKARAGETGGAVAGGAVAGGAARAPIPPAVIARGREASISDTSELAAAAAEARRSRSTLAAWTVALFGLGAVSIFVTREPEGTHSPVEALGAARHSAASEPPRALSPRGAGASLISAEDNGFAVYDGILDHSLAVPPDHALLVVEGTEALAGTTVWLNDRELGPPPQKVSLPEGVHELAIRRGDAMSYRFVSVHPGRTWVLRNP